MTTTRLILRKGLLAMLFLITGVALFSQVSYTAKDQVTPYSGTFRPGSNLGFLPLGWDNQDAADLVAGNEANGLMGIGAKAIRPSLAASVMEQFGDQIEMHAFQHYYNVGMMDLTAFLESPSDAQRDWTEYCPGKPSALFKNLYEPIWDNGENGTPINEYNPFASYVYRMVTKYNDYVKFWEIWNEPGFTYTDAGWRPPGYPGNFWENDPDPCAYKLHAPIQHYIRTLRIAWEVIKTVAPEDYVVLAGLGYPSFLDAIMRNTDNPNQGLITHEFPHRGGAYFDVLGIHSYPSIDGSLRYWDDNVQNWHYDRNSDAAAERVITHRFGAYENVMAQYGYNGSTYPKKLRTITETNVPRKQFDPVYFASEKGQYHFLMKAAITNKVNDVIQMHVYSIDDVEYEWNMTTEFESMGFYKKFTGDPQNQTMNKQGIGYKTTSDFIFNTTYDPQRTADLNLPWGIKGYAFKTNDGDYVYALWAKTQNDQSEEAFASYSFPGSLGANQFKRYNWDYCLTQQEQVIGSDNISLTGTPSFFVAITNNDPRPHVQLTTDQMVVDGSFTVQATFSEPVNGMSGNKIIIQNGYWSDFSGSGAHYSFTVHPLQQGPVIINLPAAQVTDNAGQPNTPATPLEVIFNYCEPFTNVTYTWISQVAMNGVMNPSGKLPYNDFTHITIPMDKGQPVDYAFITSYSDDGHTADAYYRVWLDINQNGQFELEEIILSEKSNDPGTGSGYLAGSFNLPANVPTGKTRMRVMMSLYDYPTGPCDYIHNGESEDYMVNIYGSGSGNDCILYVVQDEAICDDVGTPIEDNDDQFSIPITVHGLHGSGQWQTVINGQYHSGPYGQAYDFGPYLINDNEFYVEFTDAGNGGCKTTTFVQPPDHCSDFVSVDEGTDFCIPKSYNPWEEWIANVQFGDIQNSSWRKPYNDFSYLSTNVNPGESYSISLTAGYTYYTFNEFWRVWIDYNQNEQFELDEIALEQYMPSPPNGTPTKSIYGQIHIPDDAVSGSAVMRIMMSRNGYVGPCDDISRGEIEDYRVVIGGDNTASIPGCTNIYQPGNGAVDVATTTQLKWLPVTEANGYKLSLGTQPNGTDILDQFDVGNVESYSVTNLPYHTTVYVQVIPYNEAGENTDCVVGQFTTKDTTIVNPVLPECTLPILPIFGSTDQPLEVTITWAHADNADGYRVHLGTTSDSGNLLIEDVGYTTSFMTPALPHNTKVYAKIVPYNTDGAVHDCFEIYFTTIDTSTTQPELPGCISLSYPTDMSTDVPLNTQLQWTASTGALGYKLRIGTTSNAGDITDDLDVGNVTSYQPSSLPANSSIFVQLTPYNDYGEVATCAEQQFMTIDTSTNTGGGDCPTVLSGYQYLGSHEGHHYFVSNASSQWEEAVDAAAALNGYPVIINDAAENQFLTGQINEIAFIGLSDYANEGELVWVDGQPLTYTNFSNCSWCNGNTETDDYGTFMPWDGTWEIDNIWASRRYILELPCGTTDTVQCQIQATVQNIQCDDNNTPNDSSDDTFSFSVAANGTGDVWTGQLQGATISGLIGTTTDFGPYLIQNFGTGSTISLVISDGENSGCETTASFQIPPTCSDPVSNSSVDLALSQTSTPQFPGQWANVTLTLTLTNTGTEAATGIKVDYYNQSVTENWSKLGFISVDVPDGTNFNSWHGIWTVPYIGPNESLSLSYYAFTKTDQPIPVFAQVMEQVEEDFDSAPNNNTSQVPAEDDESLTIINNQEDLIGLFDESESASSHLHFFPNPTTDYILIDLRPFAESPVTISVINLLGQVTHSVQYGIDHAAIVRLNLPSLHAGQYIIKAESPGTKSKVGKLMGIGSH